MTIQEAIEGIIEFQWFRFVQVLADGNPPEAFFAPLLSSRRMASETKNPHEARLAHTLDSASQIQLELDDLYETAQ
jgi:hypothetical protein